jgi:hypothetical protein
LERRDVTVRADQFSPSPAKAGVQPRAAIWLNATQDQDNLPDWTPAFAGEAEELK